MTSHTLNIHTPAAPDSPLVKRLDLAYAAFVEQEDTLNRPLASDLKTRAADFHAYLRYNRPRHAFVFTPEICEARIEALELGKAHNEDIRQTPAYSERMERITGGIEAFANYAKEIPKQHRSRKGFRTYLAEREPELNLSRVEANAIFDTLTKKEQNKNEPRDLLRPIIVTAVLTTLGVVNFSGRPDEVATPDTQTHVTNEEHPDAGENARSWRARIQRTEPTPPSR